MTYEEALHVLSVSASADLQTIRRQYRRLASTSHPDRFQLPAERAVATERFQAISEAFVVLRGVAEDSGVATAEIADDPPTDGNVATWTAWVASAQHADTYDDYFSAPQRETPAGPSSAADWGVWLEETASDVLLGPARIVQTCGRIGTEVARERLNMSPTRASLLGTVAGHVLPWSIVFVVIDVCVRPVILRELVIIGALSWWMLSAAIAAVSGALD